MLPLLEEMCRSGQSGNARAMARVSIPSPVGVDVAWQLMCPTCVCMRMCVCVHVCVCARARARGGDGGRGVRARVVRNIDEEHRGWRKASDGESLLHDMRGTGAVFDR